jgi:hypothetical protein
MLFLKRFFILVTLASMFIWGCEEKGTKTPPIPPPKINKIMTSIEKDELLSGETVTIFVEAENVLKYSYILDSDTLTGSGSQTDFVAPSIEGTHTILVKVTGSKNQFDDSSIVITVCNSTSFGIYSEGEHCKILLDQNSFLGMYSGGGARVIEFKDDPNEKWEGDFSKKMTINVAPTGQWAGWFIMYGVEGTPDSHTRDMLLFKGGSLRFCIKSEIHDLVVSIRSGNVGAGSEYNVLLSEFPEFKVGEWVEISIPIVRFTDPPPGNPKADLSQLKILFNIASSQQSDGTNGTQSFWIDNVRWVRSGY